jgi:hypothetical protein
MTASRCGRVSAGPCVLNHALRSNDFCSAAHYFREAEVHIRAKHTPGPIASTGIASPCR